MPNFVELNYNQTGQSKKTNSLGMREMQERVYSARNAQYLLLKAPPASGKSRALMYIALDKLHRQGLKKVIIAVPEKVIASSFDKAELVKHGFFADWEPNQKYNLCRPGGESSKVQTFLEFLDNNEKILICTHSTFRFAVEKIDEKKFDNILLAIDEFHHVSADSDSRLGNHLRSIMANSNAHVMAMTGSYFRGDCIPVLLPEDEAKFTKVTYNYYEQLNGYEYLKSLGIGYHFYQGRYVSAIEQVLDTDKKTILHIPHVGSGESTKNKENEVNTILDKIGNVISQDPSTGVIYINRYEDHKTLKVADLVNDNPIERDKIISYLRSIKKSDDIDLIIALGMAKEGFDWPFCEHALTIGHRGSLTEIVQIIGRCTRDCAGKLHAQFTNLIAQPDAEDDQVKVSVNNMLKAISCSLLMEQVLAPNVNFTSSNSDEDKNRPGELKIKGLKQPSSARVKNILESDLNDLKATILQNESISNAIVGNLDPTTINKNLIPKIIKIKYPDLSDQEIEEVRQHVVVDSVIKKGEITQKGDQRFIRMANQFINIDELHIDLIDQINPFQKAYEILSKTINPQILKAIQGAITGLKIQFSDAELLDLWPKIKTFSRATGREPDLNSNDLTELRLAQALAYIRKQRQEMDL